MKHARHDANAATSSPDKSAEHAGEGSGHYGRFIIMIVLSYLAMYGLMYAMVDTFANVRSNLNQVYMAGLMTAPMVMLELGLMARMYPDRRLNLILWVVAAIALATCWIGIRQQVLIGDRQFLRSMIPHHAGAILMCNEAPLRDARVQALCRSIEESQKAEIAQMKVLLDDPAID